MSGSALGDDRVVLAPAELADVALAWPVLSTEILAEGHVATFAQDVVRTPDGGEMTREYLRHPGAVGVIALDEQERVVLVRQYRHPVRHRLSEPPAGLLDHAGEDPLVAAQRELAEEVGLSAGRWDVLVELFTTPGIIGEGLRVYLARDLAVADRPDGFTAEGEEADMDVVWASLDDLLDAVLDGRLHNPTLVSGVLAAGVARARDGFATLRPADAPWPAREALAAAGLLPD
ncbi:NUDIX hydrolase [Microlunatus antarcticus]|uniref:ADP-ribose pyrophosphatase n=1 Tax=Microlunatus antarcticus TaxID=53388 RepID=A0A7W5P6W0_9ACTN|nr:ADP-ribose pyrophosphatase [Microlunatus antarcticus]